MSKRPPPQLQRRGATAALAVPTMSPHPRPTISMEDWEAKAPLGDAQLRSIAAVKAAAEHLPLPLKFSARDDVESSGASRPDTPRGRLVGTGVSSRPSTPGAGRRPGLAGTAASRAGTSSLRQASPVRTAQAFLDLVARIERAAAHAQEGDFRARLAELRARRAECARVLGALDTVQTEVAEMLARWRAVEAGGASLEGACERLLAERARLGAITDEVDARLEFFAELERATRVLNAPGEALVLQDDFLHMVDRIDACIAFLREHRHYKESEVYLLRFQQCLTRAMTLVRMFFVGSLRALVQDVGRRLGEDVSQTAAAHLLYTRFATVARTVRPLLHALETRALANPDALGGVRDDCAGAYFRARHQLLVPRVAEEVKGLDMARAELVGLIRSGCSFLVQLCADEFALYRAFFSSGEATLYEYLEKLCDALFDGLRPRILHEQRLPALAEACTVLQALMVLEVRPAHSALNDGASASSATSEEEDDDDADELTMDPLRRKGDDGMRRLRVDRLLESVLQDAQTRLFFKAQAVLHADVRGFVPKADDLAYPAKLIEKAPAAPLREKEVHTSSFADLTKSSERRAARSTWYPPLATAVWVLGQLRDFVAPTIFDDIAQEALHLCAGALAAGADALTARAGPLDGALFAVRHLLVLKELAAGLELAHRADITSPSGAGGGVADALNSVLERTSAYLPAASTLLASLGVAPADDALGDARAALDGALKTACARAIAALAAPLADPLDEWAARVRIHTGTDKSGDVRTQAWAAPGALAALDTAFRAAAEAELRGGAARTALYVPDARTAGTLLARARERAADAYDAFADAARALHAGTPETRALMGAGELGALLRRVCEVGPGVTGEGAEAEGSSGAAGEEAAGPSA